MASVAKDTRDSFLLIETTADLRGPATACQGLCRSELAVFRAVLGTDGPLTHRSYSRWRRRCAYRITRRQPR